MYTDNDERFNDPLLRSTLCSVPANILYYLTVMRYFGAYMHLTGENPQDWLSQEGMVWVMRVSSSTVKHLCRAGGLISHFISAAREGDENTPLVSSSQDNEHSYR